MDLVVSRTESLLRARTHIKGWGGSFEPVGVTRRKSKVSKPKAVLDPVLSGERWHFHTARSLLLNSQ